jgi:hypothetical protein
MALTADIPTTRYGVPSEAHQPLSVPVAASTKPYGGAVAVSYKGYLVAASAPSSDQLVLGVMLRTADNSSGAAGDINGQVDTGSFFLFGGTSADALTQADVGQPVYLIDEKTVGKTSNTGARPVAGVLRAIDTTRAGLDYYAVTLGTPAQSAGSNP